MSDEPRLVNPIMKCGHAANAVQAEKPVCAICAGITPGWNEIDPNPPSLEGRMMRCSYCGRERNSDASGAFFVYLEGNNFDRYYCGCRGWD